jgi:methionyl-tRNA synthetase
LNHWENLKSDIFELYDTFQFHKALERIFSFIAELNRYAEVRAPWKLAKSEDSENQLRLSTTLATMSEGLRLASILLQPVMPQISEKILNSLGQNSVELFDEQLQWGNKLSGSAFGEKSILFPKNDR